MAKQPEGGLKSGALRVLSPGDEHIQRVKTHTHTHTHASPTTTSTHTHTHTQHLPSAWFAPSSFKQLTGGADLCCFLCLQMETKRRRFCHSYWAALHLGNMGLLFSFTNALRLCEWMKSSKSVKSQKHQSGKTWAAPRHGLVLCRTLTIFFNTFISATLTVYFWCVNSKPFLLFAIVISLFDLSSSICELVQ